MHKYEIHYLDRADDSIFVGCHLTRRRTFALSILKSSDGRLARNFRLRIHLPSFAIARFCISNPVVFLLSPGSSSLHCWNYQDFPNATEAALFPTRQLFPPNVEIKGVVDIAFQVLLIVTTSDCFLISLGESRTENALHQPVFSIPDGNGEIVSFAVDRFTSLLFVLTDDGCLTALDIHRANVVLWQVGLPLLPNVETLDSSTNPIIVSPTSSCSSTSSYTVVVHWNQTKRLRRRTVLGDDSYWGKFEITPEFSEEFIAVDVELSQPSIPYFLPDLGDALRLVRNEMRLSAEDCDVLYLWFKKGMIHYFGGRFVVLYGHILFEVEKDSVTGESPENAIKHYLASVHGIDFVEPERNESRTVPDTETDPDADFSFYLTSKIASGKELGQGKTRENLARALDLTFATAIDREMLMRDDFSAKAVGNELYGKLREEELGQRKVAERRARREQLSLNISRFNETLIMEKEHPERAQEETEPEKRNSQPKGNTEGNGGISSDEGNMGDYTVTIGDFAQTIQSPRKQGGNEITFPDASQREVPSQKGLDDTQVVAGHFVGQDATLNGLITPKKKKAKKKKGRKSGIGFG